MDILVAKILIIFGLLFSTLLAGLLPLLCLKLTTRHKRKLRHRKLKICCDDHDASSECPETKAMFQNGSAQSDVPQPRRKKSHKKLVISILNCFAGGIFLGTSFIGLLPEIRECFAQFDIRWPVITSSIDYNETNQSQSNTGGHDSIGQRTMPIAEIIVVGGLFFILCVEQAAHAWNHYRQKKKSRKGDNSIVGLRMSELGENTTEEGNMAGGDGNEPSVDSSEEEKPRHDHSAIRSLILVATLSLHSLLEGVAIGLQEQARNVVTIFVAVLFHKSLMAFSMGTNLVQSNQATKKIVAAAAIFSFASPIGIAFGLIIKSTGGDDSVTELMNAILQAIATGTFLYITFFEVLVKEFEAHGNRLAKVLSLFVGYGSVLGTFFANNG